MIQGVRNLGRKGTLTLRVVVDCAHIQAGIDRLLGNAGVVPEGLYSGINAANIQPAS